MTTRSIFTVLPLILVAGCWPYLGGPYEDYVDGEGTEDPDTDPDRDTRDPDTEDPDTEGTEGTGVSSDGPVIAGWVEQTVLLGEAGWSDPNAFSVLAVIAGLRDGASFDYLQGLPTSGSCVTTHSPGNNLLSALTEVGFSDVEITLSPDTFPGNPASDEPRALIGGVNGSGSTSANATVTISGQVSAGSLSGTLTRTPSTFSVDEPQMDGTDFLVLPYGEFDVEYSGTGSDPVYVNVLYLDANSDVLAGHSCLGRSGSATSDPSSLGLEQSEISAVQVIVSRVRETSGTISGSAQAESEVVGVLSQAGLFGFE